MRHFCRGSACSDAEVVWGLPKLRGPALGVRAIRTNACWDLFGGPLL